MDHIKNNPLNLQVNVAAVHFYTHDFDWENPEIVDNDYYVFKNYPCKKCGCFAYEHTYGDYMIKLNSELYKFIDNKTCSEILLEQIME